MQGLNICLELHVMFKLTLLFKFSLVVQRNETSLEVNGPEVKGNNEKKEEKAAVEETLQVSL